ncbi:MAG: hypothetical protein PHS54_05960, partial [Clostridia bacterium]|nr:hypothetical protein [Clostridia bacterium]
MKKKGLFLFLFLFFSFQFIGCEKETPKLTTPIISIAETIVSWAEVDNAEGYVVVIQNKEYEVTTTSYDFSLLAYEDLLIKVKAVTSSEDYSDSDYSEELPYHFKEVLPAPIISIDNFIVSWAAVENAEGYLVKINNGQVNVTGLSFDFSDYALEDLAISVKALGDGEDYLDSPFSDELQYQHQKKLTAPVLTLNEKKVSWAAVANAEGYVVVINNVEYQVSGTQYDFSALASQDLKIKVKAKGDGTRYLDSELSNEVNYIITYVLLAPVITNDENIISWEAIANATSYIVYINDVPTTVQTNSYTLDEAVFGEFEVSVKAVGDNIKYLDSEKSNKLQINIGIKLDGVLDEEEWAANTYSTKNTENNVSQIIHSYFGNTGLYFGIK